MGFKIVREWDLTVLRVWLEVAGRGPAMVAQLLAYLDGEKEVLWSHRYRLAEFGLAADPAPVVPPGLGDAVASILHRVESTEEALWLHLVRPHGYLGAVPWERELVPQIGLPLLRVPDRLPVAVDPGRTWRVALMVNARRGSGWAGEHVPALLQALDEQVAGVPLEVHVFADLETAEAVSSGLSKRPVAAAVKVHAAAVARSMGAEWVTGQGSRTRAWRRTASTAAQVWTGWLTGSLADRSVSAVHLLGDGLLDGDEPLFRAAPNPAEPADGCLSADDITTLADAVGAATISFGSPPGNPSDLATRMLANEVGFRRPGPTLYVDLARDPGGRALAGGYGFLADPAGSGGFPRSPAMFAYLQPEQVRSGAAEPWPEPAQAIVGTAPATGLLSTYETADELPGWVGPSERYVDAKQSEIVQVHVDPDAAATKRAYDEGSRRGLAELRAILDQHIPGGTDAS